MPALARRPAAPSLFDAIYENNPAEVEFAFGANSTDASWAHDYKLIDTPEAFASFLAELKKQKRFVFDLETTSIDPIRAVTVGYAIAWKAAEAYYVAVRGPAEDQVLDSAAVLAALKPILEDPAVAKAHLVSEERCDPITGPYGADPRDADIPF